jgi:uncharacterized protein
VETIPNPSGKRASPDRGLEHQDAVLDELVVRLVAAYDPLQIYLFGSKARGDAGPDSDYDLLLVVPDDASSERKAQPAGLRSSARHWHSG